MSKVIEIVNERIMKQLEAGTIPWQKPWTGVRNGAYSRSTGKPYSLINQMLLGSPGEYLTVKQIMEAGGKLKKDEKPSMVVFWKQVPRKMNQDGEEKTVTYPMLRYYRVYHIDQCEGIEPKYTPEELPEFVPVEEAERLSKSYLERSGCSLAHEKQDRAFYSPRHDSITLPLREQFTSPDGYYGTLFHEVGHSTGHASRLNRFATDGYNHEAYSREELVAELIAASTLNLLGMETDKTIMDSAAYIGSWLKALKDDKRMLVWAASRAEKALGIITEDVDIAAVTPDEAMDETEEPAGDVEPIIATAPADTGSVVTKAMEKSALRFAKSCAKTMKDRPIYAGAVPHGGKQYITNGFIMAVYNKPIAGLPEADLSKGNPGPSLEGIIGPSRLGVGQTLPSLQALREQFKAAKDKSGLKKFVQYTKLGPNYYNSEYLMTAMELSGIADGGDFARYQTVNRPLYIDGKDCEVIVLPVNVKGMPAAEVWHPKLTA